ncbi:hypothetical protein, partial [Listeria monocytogenes]|uniref:hypothetical protein n=1 Tax=Listeria monocytogenes TaxID=1639 RepID=UPI001C0A8EBF
MIHYASCTKDGTQLWVVVAGGKTRKPDGALKEIKKAKTKTVGGLERKQQQKESMKKEIKITEKGKE